MDTHYAPAERATAERIHLENEILNRSAVMDGLLETVGGLLAILNKHRQIVSLNDSFLSMLGIQDAENALGLRPGEALNCVHSKSMPGGCGTSEYCSTCGAAMAIVSSLEQNKPVENICALKAQKNGDPIDIVLNVRSHPVLIEDTKFLMVFLQDITLQQQRAALERTFFHDINNMLSGLVGASEILANENQKSPMVDIVRRSSLRLQKAVEIQRILLECESDSYLPMQQKISVKQMEEDLYALFMNHPARANKQLDILHDLGDFTIKTDISLLQRVLANMITNALEASNQGGKVTFSVLLEDSNMIFNIHNTTVIPEDVQLRVFQRNFSTKANTGRGIGTFSMKLFGEKILGGQVSFTSTPEEGTCFTFALPLEN